MLEGCSFVVVCLIVGGFLFLSYLLYVKWPQAEREDSLKNQLEIAERQLKHLETGGGGLNEERAIRELLGFFPFFERALSLREFLETNLVGIASIGEMADGLPVPSPSSLPLQVRSKHTAIFGKTGSGKSTCLEHLIAHDIEEKRSTIVISPESGFFKERILNFIPGLSRFDVIYFAPGDSSNTLTFNPLSLEVGDNLGRASDEIFSVLSRLFGKDELGVRGKPILQNALSAILSYPEASLLDLKHFLEDASFRAEVLRSASDHTRDFFSSTYSRFPKGAELPIIHRLDRFLRPRALRETLLKPSSWSLRDALAEKKLILVDLSGLSELEADVLGGLILSKLQLELFRRELGGEKTPSFVYVDEFHRFASDSPELWRSLLSRGRKYGAALTLASQSPSQLPKALEQELFSNVASLITFSLGERDARSLRREFLVDNEGKLEPVEATKLLQLRTGQALMKLDGGLSFEARIHEPLERFGEAERIIRASRLCYGWRDDAVVERPTERDEIAAPPPEVDQLEINPPPVAKQLNTPPKAIPPSTKPPPKFDKPKLPGRGGERHRYLQELIRRLAQAEGFKALVEEKLSNGSYVDILLERDGRRIAVEVAESSSVNHELENVSKCLEAGVDHVLVVAERPRFLKSMNKALKGEKRAEALLVEELANYFKKQGKMQERRVAGYKVTSRYTKDEDGSRARAVARVLARSLQKPRSSK